MFNLNTFARSFYNKALIINQQIAQKTGLNTYWMRAIPDSKGADVIFHEYTLYNVDCPVQLKIVPANPSFDPGKFNLELFGLDYDSPFEIQIDKLTWKAAFTQTVMPQKGDIVYIEILNCLFEVASSTVMYTYSELETGFKVDLQKYTPRADRRENGVKDTIDDMTTGESRLFGDKISEEVSDMVDNDQLDQQAGTFQNDSYKSCDLRSIVMEDLGFASSYYNMYKTSQSIIYKSGDTISKTDELPYRYFSVHFRINDKDETEAVKLENEITRKNGVTTFEMKSTLSMVNGQKVDFSRGSSITIEGIVSGTVKGNDSIPRYLIAFSTTDVNVLKRKFTNWYSSALRATKSAITPLLLGKTDGNTVFNISIVGNSEIYIKIGSTEKIISISAGIPTNEWIGCGINLMPSGDLYLFRGNSDSSLGNMFFKTSVDILQLEDTIRIGTFYITESNSFLTNIRLYKISDIVDENTVLKDLSSKFVYNNSVAVINDSAVIPNVSPYIGSMK